MYIRNKDESRETIKRLGLNVINSKTFTVSDKDWCTESIKAFMAVNGDVDKLWNIRDAGRYSGRFIKGVKISDITKEIVGKYNKITISESMEDYDKNNIVIQGDIKLTRDFDVIATLSDKKGYTLRECTNNSKLSKVYRYNDAEEKCHDKLSVDIGNILNYMSSRGIFDTYMEFTMYNVPVGIKHECIIVWELRNS